jgi:hypothetical protein
MTNTAKELIADPNFWLLRVRQQEIYIREYKASKVTRPDKQLVLTSAYEILQRCWQNYYGLTGGV